MLRSYRAKSGVGVSHECLGLQIEPFGLEPRRRYLGKTLPLTMPLSTLASSTSHNASLHPCQHYLSQCLSPPLPAVPLTMPLSTLANTTSHNASLHPCQHYLSQCLSPPLPPHALAIYMESADGYGKPVLINIPSLF